MMTTKKSFDVPAPYYPILYSPGHAMTATQREEFCNDATAGSVKKDKQQKQMLTRLPIFSKANLVDTVKLKHS
ncbi:hypothetical protein HQN86_24785 [Pedobacter panaciterrae]|uniref:hypothetical protein n=1 Tax=Pedobacter panaciterrae TaxID=363849 RepID=UPI00155DBEE5|nr:hypothetical protein [Pedobacter panaciterrae]NQX56857.1 hypothetical protein [Pedobacter panaciterrae]